MKLAENPLLMRHVGKPAILDSNLLLLYWCSSYDPELVGSFKRLNSFRIQDVDLLLDTLKFFPVLRTTPHVLTEVSNLANQLPGWVRDHWFEHFSRQIQIIQEEWVPAATIATSDLMWLGLTDAMLAELAKSHVILTIDFPLSNSLESRGLNVINFTHLRDFDSE